MEEYSDEHILKMYEAQAIAIEKEEELKKNERLLREREKEVEHLQTQVGSLKRKKVDRLNIREMINKFENLDCKFKELSHKTESIPSSFSNKQMTREIPKSKPLPPPRVQSMTAPGPNFFHQEQQKDLILTGFKMTTRESSPPPPLPRRQEIEEISSSSSYNLFINLQEERAKSSFEIATPSVYAFDGLFDSLILSHERLGHVKEEVINPSVALFTDDENIYDEIEDKIDEDKSVLILGGEPFNNSLYLYNSHEVTWQRLEKNLPFVMKSFGAVCLNDEIYVIGGSSAQFPDEFNHCYKLGRDGIWSRLARLNEGRAEIAKSCIIFQGSIWVMGGVSGKSHFLPYLAGNKFHRLKSVERYDFFENKWFQQPDLIIPRENAAAAILNGKIIVSGGKDENSLLKSVEIFDPDIGKWSLFCNLPIGITSHSMIIGPENLLIAGGATVFGKSETVYKYNFKTRTWTRSPMSPNAGNDIGAVKTFDQIFLFGRNSKGLGNVKIFDGNVWINGPELDIPLEESVFVSIPKSVEERLLLHFTENSSFRMEI